MLRKSRSLMSLVFGRRKLKEHDGRPARIEASVSHALLVIFLEYFAWGLLTVPVINAITFSVVLAYVADITEKQDRSAAYGLVSATFAASLVTSPALGAWISEGYGDGAVVLLATIVAAADVVFIVLFVPESLPAKRLASDVISWQNADPFASLRIVWEDKLVRFQFLSTVHMETRLLQMVGFSPEAVAAFIGLVGILSVVAQTGVLLLLTNYFGTKHTITLGLVFQLVQLAWYGLGTQYILSSQFPAVRIHPVSLGEKILSPRRNETTWTEKPVFDWQLIPGPPFLAGALLVLLALLCNSALPSTPGTRGRISNFIYLCHSTKSPTHSHQSSDTTRLLHSDSPHC
uniref:Solute carrier family 40 protein n=1 Tax=Heterorhabditis bacteriophora TaxID=37862 RepID=A0A1I7XE63_HETBA